LVVASASDDPPVVRVANRKHAFFERQHTEQIECAGMQRNDFLLPGDGDERRPRLAARPATAVARVTATNRLHQQITSAGQPFFLESMRDTHRQMRC
jgi:hypothetical protein